MTPGRPPRPTSPHLAPLTLLAALCLAFWSRVLVTGNVLLPGAMLSGFAPFGGDPRAPWNILQWDSLGQYYPWRTLAARQIHDGLIPLWNPHQFAGAPLLANGQSAVFYPLSLPFWLMDVAYAFGVSALLHSLLAAGGTYFLAQRLGLSRAGSLLAAIGFTFCGYLTAWIMLPTLANTAVWLPLLLLLLDNAMRAPGRRGWTRAALGLTGATTCALLAGHPQIFFYLLVGLGLYALCHKARLRGLGAVAVAASLALLVGAVQVLPLLELARLGHRAAQGGASREAWAVFIVPRALTPDALPSLVVPAWPTAWGDVNENFGYVGIGLVLLALAALLWFLPDKAAALAKNEVPSPTPPSGRGMRRMAVPGVLAIFGLLYATATPLAMLFYLYVPGLAQMGGVGRALVLWSLGIALLAGLGMDAVRRHIKSAGVPIIAMLLVTAELFANGFTSEATAPRATIYPATPLIRWLKDKTRDGSRVLFMTPRQGWRPAAFDREGRHPPGVLPPNGATVYGLLDVNGYDSLAPKAYRDFVVRGEGADISPPLNANIIMLENPASPALDTLNVRYVVSQAPLDFAGGREAWRGDGCIVYERSMRRTSEKAPVYPGIKAGRYEPQTFRFGLFLSLAMLMGLVGAGVTLRRP